MERNESFMTNVLLLGNKSLNPNINESIILCIIEYLLSTQKFTSSLKGTFADNCSFFIVLLLSTACFFVTEELRLTENLTKIVVNLG